MTTLREFGPLIITVLGDDKNLYVMKYEIDGLESIH